MPNNIGVNEQQVQEKVLIKKMGWFALFLCLVGFVGSIILFVSSMVSLSSIYGNSSSALFMLILSIIIFIVACIMLGGFKILAPNEALVLTLFGKYHGTLKSNGFYFVNPFCSAVNPGSKQDEGLSGAVFTKDSVNFNLPKKKMSLKYRTLDNGKQKINDELGNPIIIGIVVVWRIVDTAKAAFNVDNYTEFLSVQCDSALRNIVRMYPYDLSEKELDNEKSLRGSSQEIAEKLRQEIQEKMQIAGIEISEARITHLAYAPEIAAAMLQRQQASAIIDARQMIVEGAVSMVEMALDKLENNNVVHLSEDKKATMVSNLLVVLCGNKDPQPVLNSGSGE